jgi:hypothetical protein
MAKEQKSDQVRRIFSLGKIYFNQSDSAFQFSL